MHIALSELVGCGKPDVPVNGYKIGDNYWAGQLVIFACDSGYHLEGPSNRLVRHSKFVFVCFVLFCFLFFCFLSKNDLACV